MGVGLPYLLSDLVLVEATIVNEIVAELAVPHVQRLVLLSIHGGGQILREGGPDFCSRERGSKNSPGRRVKYFFAGRG